MKEPSLRLLFLTLVVLGASISSHAQVKWVVGGNLGISIGSGWGGSSAGLQLGPMAEAVFNKNMGVGSELNINTQAGTPIEWANYFKYYFSVPSSNIRPFANAGFGLWLVTGGPYFGLRFGGGANFPIARNLSIAPELQLGPVFTTGSSTFVFVIRGGIRYDI